MGVTMTVETILVGPLSIDELKHEIRPIVEIIESNEIKAYLRGGSWDQYKRVCSLLHAAVYVIEGDLRGISRDDTLLRRDKWPYYNKIHIDTLFVLSNRIYELVYGKKHPMKVEVEEAKRREVESEKAQYASKKLNDIFEHIYCLNGEV